MNVLHPLRGSEDQPTYLTRQQKNWLDAKAEECLEVGPCRFLPGGAMLVEVQTLFDQLTFVIDREGNELNG